MKDGSEPVSDVHGFDDWREANARMVDRLTEAGLLPDQRWRAAFSSVPRHVFVPRFLRESAVISALDPTTVGQWHASIYTDTTLITQTAPAPGYNSELPTSSSTLPSLMAYMLNLLRVDSDCSVLEIGTATGYNTALLCQALGHNQVSTVEIHPDLSVAARDRLSSLAMHPSVIIGDGRDGYSVNAPYDRIISTCAANTIPRAWVQQLADGGRIVTDLRSEISSSLAVLDKTGSDRVEGRLLDYVGNFMWLRPDPKSPMLDPSAPDLAVHRDDESNHTTTTSLDLHTLGKPGFQVALGTLEPTLRLPLWMTDHRLPETDDYFLYAADGSWSDAAPNGDGQHAVTQGGPRRVWDSVERAAAQWRGMGEPERGRYGVTVTVEGTHHYWVDEPARRLWGDASGRAATATQCW